MKVPIGIPVLLLSIFFFAPRFPKRPPASTTSPTAPGCLASVVEAPNNCHLTSRPVRRYGNYLRKGPFPSPLSPIPFVSL